jgi:flagellar motor switch protein FliG
MSELTANLRKAAILIRSVDVDTAAVLLAQLSPVEARSVREAIKALGAVDDEERADVVAEIRRTNTIAAENPRDGVELNFSANAADAELRRSSPSTAHTRPFDFLEHARIESLVPYLAREHAQTVAIVLSYLTPSRAAEVLAALPAKLQALAVERLAALGETDADCVQVVERELAAWVRRQQAVRSPAVRIDSISAILAAADDVTRSRILANVMQNNERLAKQIAPPATTKPPREAPPPKPNLPQLETTEATPVPPPPKPRPIIPFESLMQLDADVLGSVLRAVDPELIVLALTGASEELVARITAPMAREMAAAFRKRLYKFGPTRLRDVEAAQREVATIATHQLHALRAHRPALAG